MNQKTFHEQETMANHPPALNPFEPILLRQIYWDFLFVSYSPSFFSSKIFSVDLQVFLHCAPSRRYLLCHHVGLIQHWISNTTAGFWKYDLENRHI